MSLKKYREKRNFKQTPEPKGVRKHSSKEKIFVIQKHAASHLHYDFRLEMNGTLKSWAVPKGPCLDPTVKRLAVQVEDHPLAYASFEGNIPKGQYGGGSVIIWDNGTWIMEEEHNGNLTFTLQGKKLKGLWKLVQIKKDPKNWLLIKVKDKYAKSIDDYDITQEKPLSIISHKSVEALGNKVPTKKKPQKISNKKFLPKNIYPQLATLVNTPPNTKDWLHEIKLDGYRLVCYITNDNKIRLMTRGQQDWSHKFPHLIKKIQTFKLNNTILDGEIVAINNNKKFDFQLLQNSIHDKEDIHLKYYLFDVIYHDGIDLSTMPLIERKKILKQLIKKNNTILFSEYVIGNGDKVFNKACKLTLEGIVSKNIHSHYVQKRTHSWLKIKCIQRQEFVVGGFTKPKGSRKHLGSLLLGVYKDKQLHYCGHVGTGFTETSLCSMAALLEKHKTNQMPFYKRPPKVKDVTWIKPQVVVEVEFTEVTDEGILRHPSFKGLRKDKSAKKIIMEVPKK